MVCGLILPIVGFPVFGIHLVAALGFGLIAYGAWRLGNHIPMFLIAGLAAALTGALFLGARWLHDTPAAWLSSLSWPLILVLGWFLLSAVASDCQAQGQLDLASAARIRRYIFLFLEALPVALAYLFPFKADQSPALILLPMVLNIAAYALLLWTVQSAKIRLFP